MPPQQLLAKADPVLATLIATLPEPTVTSTGEVFHDLVSCVVEQQIHYRSTKGTFWKLLRLAEVDTLTPDNFPLFEEKALPTIKLSASKYETLGHILDFCHQKNLDWTALTDEEAVAQLASIKGIGPWTIDMIRLYTLQRPDVFPADDFHLKQVMVNLYGLNAAARLRGQMLEVANNWGEQRSLAVRYLLTWKEHTKKLSRS
ncbi:DNA-3-methyladenine glycosylase family protein [Telluribacter humicola]|uniref:DNA-3-methyladenine glycosylase family protein n=1 Tax=Telluribacter humicola TaxID=1720261 RepID=UPI001A95A035|nr:DNA-3-methyladenine glycosylase 2 family protein [Telluribacter humicola]